MRRRTCLAGGAAALLRLAAPAGMALAADSAAASTRIGGLSMGMGWQVSLARRPGAAAERALSRLATAELQRVEAAMSTWLPGSELSRLNAAPGGTWTAVSRDTLQVVQAACGEHARSGGAFDPTVGPLVDLWGFGPGASGAWPDDEALADACARAGLEAVTVDAARRAVHKARDGIALDLCGIAKGYAVDRIAAALEAAGLDDYLVDVGGELRGRGRTARGAPWRVGIERPLPGRVEVRRVVALDGEAIATSGNYRQYFERGGRRYCHAVDPRSGMPVSHRLAAVSVIAPSAMAADALSTALMVLGPEAGPALAERLGIPALFQVRGEGGVSERASAGFTDRAVM